jgi:hypothetical protein
MDPPFFAGFFAAGFLDRVSELLEAVGELTIELIVRQ